jgi:hypothetical protein
VTAQPFDALSEVVAACRTANVEYAVIGAVARNAWATPRATTDLDLAIAVTIASYARLISALSGCGFEPDRAVTAEEGDPLPDVALLRRATGTVRRLDLLIAKSEFEQEAVREAPTLDLGVSCRVVRPEHLIVYKLIAGRPRDLDDAEEVARTRTLAGNPVDFAVVRRWAIEWKVEARLYEMLRSLGEER